MTINKKFLTSKKITSAAFIAGVALAVAGSVVATSIGTNISVDGTLTNTGAATFSSTIAVTGAATFSSTVTATGALYASSTANTTGLSVFTGGFISSASSSMAGNLVLTGGNVGIGTTTVATAALAVGGNILANQVSTSATTSVTVSAGIPAGTTKFGGCINLRATDGTMIRIYATTSPLARQTYSIGLTATENPEERASGYKNLIVEAGSC